MKKIIILIAVCLVVALCISLISIPHKGKWVDPKQIAVSKVEEKRMNSHIIPLDFACTEDGTTFLLISYPLDKDMYLLKSNDKGLTWSAPAKIGHGEYGCMEAVGNQVYVMGIGYDEKFFQKFNNKGEAIGKKHYFYETKLNFGKMLVKDKDNIFILVIRSEMLSFTKSADGGKTWGKYIDIIEIGQGVDLGFYMQGRKLNAICSISKYINKKHTQTLKKLEGEEFGEKWKVSDFSIQGIGDGVPHGFHAQTSGKNTYIAFIAEFTNKKTVKGKPSAKYCFYIMSTTDSKNWTKPQRLPKGYYLGIDWYFEFSFNVKDSNALFSWAEKGKCHIYKSDDGLKSWYQIPFSKKTNNTALFALTSFDKAGAEILLGFNESQKKGEAKYIKDYYLFFSKYVKK